MSQVASSSSAAAHETAVTRCHGVLEEDGALVGASSLFPSHWLGTRQELAQETHLRALDMEKGACAGRDASTCASFTWN